jgi:hypothetical protein
VSADERVVTSSRPRGALRAGALLLCFAATASALGLGIVRATQAARTETPLVGITFADYLQKRVSALGAAADRRDVFRVGFLGDSTAVSYALENQVPTRLQQAAAELARGRPEIEVHSLAMQGMWSFDYYFWADVIAAAKPSQLVVSFSLESFSEAFREVFSRPQLAGWMGSDRLAGALGLPLDWIGLTWDRLLFYHAVVRLGGYETWRALSIEQARVRQARDDLASRISGGDASPERALGQVLVDGILERKFVSADLRRFSQTGQREHLGLALSGVRADHPLLRVLAATLRSFERAGIPVLVYVNPTNVEYVESLGLLDEAGLRTTLATLEAVARENGADFVDLHALLPDQGFRDAPGHFSVGEVHGPARLAEALAPFVVCEARRHGGEAP